MSERIVWVLGAGFSRPLGGPLLGDLFTTASAGNLDARYPRASYPLLHSDAADFVRWLYRWGLGEDAALPAGIGSANPTHERLWENAEEFLEYLDTAVTMGAESPGWRRIAPLVNRYVTSINMYRNPSTHVMLDTESATRRAIANAARRLLAAECSAFLPSANEQSPSERWTPYRQWWKTVRLEQTIISFNYDLVVERLDSESPTKLYVVPPGPKRELPLDKVPLIKLHGSVDWLRIPGQGVPDTFAARQAEDFAITCEDSQLAIASPGMTKQRAVRDDFASLWAQAADALAKADAVVFIGYRFPPTDSEALSQLLAALGRNNTPHLAMHIVLGPKRSDDVVRLESLLRYSARVARRTPTPRRTYAELEEAMRRGQHYYSLVSQALWSQDFLLVAQPHELLQSYLVEWG